MIFGDFLGDSKKAVKMELLQGGGYAIRPRRRMFRKGRPLSLWLHFGLHFGDILRAQFATILLFDRRSRQEGGQRGTFWAMRFWTAFLMDFRCQRDLQEGSLRQGRGTLWRLGNIAFGPLEDDITMCF